MGLASTAPADSSFTGVSRLVEYEVRVTGPLVNDPLAAEGPSSGTSGAAVSR